VCGCISYAGGDSPPPPDPPDPPQPPEPPEPPRGEPPAPPPRGLHSLTSKLTLEDLRDTLLTSELNLSTFGTRPRVTLVCMGATVSLS